MELVVQRLVADHSAALVARPRRLTVTASDLDRQAIHVPGPAFLRRHCHLVTFIGAVEMVYLIHRRGEAHPYPFSGGHACTGHHLPGLPFPALGQYRFVIYIDQTQLEERSFEIVSQPGA